MSPREYILVNLSLTPTTIECLLSLSTGGTRRDRDTPEGYTREWTPEFRKLHTQDSLSWSTFDITENVRSEPSVRRGEDGVG